MAKDTGEPRVEGLIRRLHAALLLTFIALGTPFVIRYRSENPAFGPYSLRYLAGVIGPWILSAGLVAALGSGRAGRRLLSWLSRPPRGLAAAVAFAAIVAGMVYGLRVSDEYVSVLMLLLAPGLVAFLWAESSRGAAPLLASGPLLAAGIALFAIELPSLMLGQPLVVWGDESTFATLFPKEPPFIGPGGRLRRRLDARMRAPEYPRGARIVTNDAGFRNTTEASAAPAPSEARVLSLGDSFSTGYCADQEAFFGALLARALAGSDPARSMSVLNAEVSDPAYGLVYLQQHGMALRPSLVIYGLSGNDVMQAEQFHGADRLFSLDGQGRLHRSPGFDPRLQSAWDRYRDFAYPVPGGRGPGPRLGATALLAKLARFQAFSWVAAEAARGQARPAVMPSYAESHERQDGRKRLIDGMANLGFFYVHRSEPIERSYRAAFDLLAQMDRTAREGGARFLLVIHPQRYQVQPADWEIMKARWRLSEADFDLRLANRRLAGFCAEREIACCDLLDAFIEAAPSGNLYLPGGDTHYNRRGHDVAARAAASCVAAQLGAAPR